MTTSFETLRKEMVLETKKKIELARHDYDQAIEDCKQGIYDKWFRYHRKDDGRAYDLGWMWKNHEIKNETVTFLRG